MVDDVCELFDGCRSCGLRGGLGGLQRVAGGGGFLGALGLGGGRTRAGLGGSRPRRKRRFDL